MGVEATYVKLDKATSSSYLYEQVKLANSKGSFDCMVQIHFNAGSSDPNKNTAGRGTNHKVIKTIPKGTEFTVGYCLNNWFSTYDFGELGYLSGDYVELI